MEGTPVAQALGPFQAGSPARGAGAGGVSEKLEDQQGMKAPVEFLDMTGDLSEEEDVPIVAAPVSGAARGTRARLSSLALRKPSETLPKGIGASYRPGEPGSVYLSSTDLDYLLDETYVHDQASLRCVLGVWRWLCRLRGVLALVAAAAATRRRRESKARGSRGALFFTWTSSELLLCWIQICVSRRGIDRRHFRLGYVLVKSKCLPRASASLPRAGDHVLLEAGA